MEKTLRASAAYDFLTIFPFAIPGLADADVRAWKGLHVAMHLKGAFPAFEPFHMLFLNMFGIFVSVWAIVRWMNPRNFLLRADVCARAAIGVLLLFYAFSGSTSQIIILFIPAEFLFLILLARYWGGQGNRG